MLNTQRTVFAIPSHEARAAQLLDPAFVDAYQKARATKYELGAAAFDDEAKALELLLWEEPQPAFDTGFAAALTAANSVVLVSHHYTPRIELKISFETLSFSDYVRQALFHLIPLNLGMKPRGLRLAPVQFINIVRGLDSVRVDKSIDDVYTLTATASVEAEHRLRNLKIPA